jgi:hypothetical protein
MKKSAWAMVFLLPLLASCLPLEGKAAEDKDYSETLISDFETAEEVKSINVFSSWGAKKGFVDDTSHIKHGKGSMYLEYDPSETIPMPNFYPDFYKDNRLLFYASTSSYITSRRTIDYSNVESFVVDVYGAAGRSFNVYLNIVTGSSTIRTPAEIVVDGRWNTLVFHLDPKSMVSKGIDRVDTIYLSFDLVYYGSSAIKMYLDDFRTRDYLSAPDTTLTLPSVASGFVYTFDDDYTYETSEIVDTWYTSTTRLPIVEKNSNPTYVKEGSSSMKITRFPTISQDSSYRRSYDLLFDSSYLAAIPFASYDPTATSIVFDAYNRYDYKIDCIMKVTTSGGYTNVIDYLDPNIWTEVVLPMDHICDDTGVVADWKNVLNLRFMLHDFYGASPAYLYLDNMRFVANKDLEAQR